MKLDEYTINTKEAFKLMVDGYILEGHTGFKYHLWDGCFVTTEKTELMFKVIDND